MLLRELYQEMIIDHGKNPRNRGVLQHANHQHAGHNPLCGDQLILQVFEQNGVVEEVCFEGTGCAISVASASLMTESIKGKTVKEIERLFEDFHHLVTQGNEKNPQNNLGKLAIFAGVAAFPIRVKCATLAWHTLKAALEDENKPVSTE
ncbi:MAG: SUF system NifU family Fe-S cluster assembly protein [Gammaproteobacteria bacterium RIFCSPHIGHO2_12_FULL_37_14]|nr:MAG: SUF system NifU family Fe-S cluster assembly protein [Gammaproteobacteria bacterium RIFCSPHIGHO2_12_FULL_37_14]